MKIEGSLDEKVRKVTEGIRIRTTQYLEIYEENRAGPWKVLDRLPAALKPRDIRDADAALLTPVFDELKQFLSPLGESVTRTKEGVQLILNKLDTPSFQEKIRESLAATVG